MNCDASTLSQPETLQMAAQLSNEIEERWSAAQQFLQEHLGNNVEDACVTSSFQAEDVVVLHMVRAILPRIPVLFLETGYHFPETLTYRDYIATLWEVNLINVLPEHTV